MASKKLDDQEPCDEGYIRLNDPAKKLAEGPDEYPDEGPVEEPAEGPDEYPAEGPAEEPAENPNES